MRYLIDTSSLIAGMHEPLLDQLRNDERVSELATIPSVLRELEGFASEGGERGRAAKAALRWAKQTLKTGPEPASSGHVDDALLEAAEAQSCGIVSQDHELIRRAKERGISTLTLKRSGKIGD